MHIRSAWRIGESTGTSEHEGKYLENHKIDINE